MYDEVKVVARIAKYVAKFCENTGIFPNCIRIGQELYSNKIIYAAPKILGMDIFTCGYPDITVGYKSSKVPIGDYFAKIPYTTENLAKELVSSVDNLQSLGLDITFLNEWAIAGGFVSHDVLREHIFSASNSLFKTTREDRNKFFKEMREKTDPKFITDPLDKYVSVPVQVDMTVHSKNAKADPVGAIVATRKPVSLPSEPQKEEKELSKDVLALHNALNKTFIFT